MVLLYAKTGFVRAKIYLRLEYSKLQEFIFKKLKLESFGIERWYVLHSNTYIIEIFCGFIPTF